MLLKDILQLKYGKNQAEVADSNGKYPIYGTGGVMGYANDFLYNKPSILFGRKGSISKVQFVDKPFWCVDTTFYSIIDESKVIPKYLFYKFENIDFSVFDEGTTIPSLRTETLNKLNFSIDSMDLQQHIVDTIGSVDNLIEKYEEIINKSNKFFNYLYDKNTQIKEVVLQNIAEIKYGKGLTASDLSFNNKYKVYGGNGIIGTLPTYEHENNKIAISCRGAASGNLLLTEEYSTISSNSLYLNLYDETHFSDIYYYLLKANLDSLTTGSAQPQITIENIKDLKIKICTDSLLNQKAKQILDSNFKYNKKIDKLKEIKQTLLQKYFG